MNSSTSQRARPSHGIIAPLRFPVFRRIWIASLLSNLGLLIMGVGAAWAMTRMTASANMVALVQTALMLPTALVALPHHLDVPRRGPCVPEKRR